MPTFTESDVQESSKMVTRVVDSRRTTATYDVGVTESVSTTSPREAYELYRRRRDEMVSLPQGNLALILTQ
ncbi:MAG: hypothetical protein EBR52_03460, partial [Microbacteriaceae bacterium]|nr:hypothetical protein [Microbacteriaceae bacterium]